jgi:uncharacterized protein (DUF1697 family)
MKYIALLRGINVGGKSKVDMGRLKLTFEKIGFENVFTYINTGNVIFSSDLSTVQSTIEKSLKKDFGFEIKVLIRTHTNLQELCDLIPEYWQNNNTMKTDVLFLWEEMDRPETLDTIIQNPEVDTLIYVPGAIVWHIDKSKYNLSGMHKFVGTRLYKSMTARNVNTVRKLEELGQK